MMLKKGYIFMVLDSVNSENSLVAIILLDIVYT